MSDHRGNRRDNPYPPNRGRWDQRSGGRSNYSHGGQGRGGRHYRTSEHSRNYYNVGSNNDAGRGRRDDFSNSNRTQENHYGPPGNSNQEREGHDRYNNGYGRNNPAGNQLPRPGENPFAVSSMPTINQNGQHRGSGNSNQQPTSMVVDRTPGETGEMNGNVASRPDMPDSEAVDESTPFLKESYREQLIAQIPESESDMEAFKRNLPVESLNPRTKAGKKPHLDEWKYKKDKLAQKLVEEMKRTEDFAPSDASDSDDSYAIIQRHSEIKEIQETLANFILALPTCHLMTIGFDYSGVKGEDEKCFCPCNKQTSNWRSLVCVEIGIDGVCGKRESQRSQTANKCFQTPNAFVAHLKSQKSCRFHKYTLKYLEELYRNWHVSKNLKHKGLYIEGTKDYKKAVDEEKQQRERRMFAELEERDEERRKLRELMDKLRKTNVELAKYGENRRQNFEAILTRVGVDVTNIEDWVPPSADEMFTKHKERYNDFFAFIHHILRLEGKKTTKRLIRVKPGFCLQECFEEWSNDPEEHFAGILFRDFENEDDARQLLSVWMIEYSANEILQGTGSDVEDDFKAKDEGGPENQFFSDVWDQLLCLEVSFPFQGGNRRVRLFEKTDEGYFQPMGDSRFELFGKKSEQNELRMAAEEKAGQWYRAIGRLLAHRICRREYVPDHILPNLHCNVAFRGCKPTDPDYPSLDLVKHMLNLGVTSKTVAAMKGESPVEFRETIEEQYVTGNAIWLNNFTEGLTVRTTHDCFPISLCLSSFPLETVERLIFASQRFSAEELLSKMAPEYSDDDTLKQTQEIIYDQALRNIVDKWDKEDPKMLLRFVQFCTGQNYISRDPQAKFIITVAFELQTEEGESSSDERLPESHTCINRLSIPVKAYNGDFEVFEAKLTEALEYYNMFTRQ